MAKRKKKSKRKKRTKRKKKRRLRARDFGDNPKIRHSYREHTTINLNEPWERYYWKIKRLKKLSKA